MKENARQRWSAARGKWRIRAIRGGKWWRERGQKGLSMIPHLFTLLNLAFGVLSIFLSMQQEYARAALLTAASLAADGLDGRLARILRADGEFGKELDSLADIVSFGTAPAILLYQISLRSLGFYGLLFILLFPLCGALRLARFNIVKTSGFFQGVPITAAGTLLACISYYTIQESTRDPVVLLQVLIVVLLSYLMVSTIPYPDFKKLGNKQHTLLSAFVGPVLVVCVVMAAANWNPWALVTVPLTAYVALGPWLLLLKQWQERIRPRLVRPNGESR